MTIPLIIDTDPGVDDAYALCLTAGAPEADLLAVTTTYGNLALDGTTGNARRVLGMPGRDDVPIGRGAEGPLVHPVARRAEDVHGDDGLGGCAARFGPLAPEPVGRAQDLLARALEAATAPVTLAAIGPLTNVALLCATRPDLVPRLGRLVVMGGSIGEGGNVSPAGEFNVWSDPEAARRVLVEETARHGLPTTLVPLDLTHAIGVDASWLASLEASGPVGAALAATRTGYLDTPGRFAHPGERRLSSGTGDPRWVAIHDAVALLEAVVPGTLATTALHLEVDTSLGPSRGAVIADRRGREGVVDVALPTSVDAATGAGTDTEAVRAALLARLSRAPHRPR